MRLFLSQPSSLAYVCLLFAAAMLPSHAAAQTIQTSEYIYIGIEAEDHDSKEDRWVTTTPTTPTTEDDPDGNHSDQAGGSTYLELLPDQRVLHADTEFTMPYYWAFGGDGPQVDYNVNFPEAGRYYVHARIYSTGTEDNGMHIGINETWPDSGHRMQFCTSAKKAWSWGSNQRDSGGAGSCGVEKTIWIDVPTAGIHTFNVSAREDGFELDRIALIKDLSGNTRICSPNELTEITCRNGSIENSDDFVDMSVVLSSVATDAGVVASNPTVVELGSNVKLTATIENLDSYDTAHDIVMTLSLGAGDWKVIDLDNGCTAVGNNVECSLAELEPTAPNENEQFEFTLQALDDGQLSIDASVATSDVDDVPANDEASITISVPAIVVETDIKVSLGTNSAEYETGESVAISVVVSNVSDTADDVLFSLALPSGLSLDSQSLPNECSYTTQVQCTFSNLGAASSESFSFDMDADEAGVYSLRADIYAEFDINSANNTDSSSFIVADVEAEVVVEPEGEGEGEGEGESEGETGTESEEATDSGTSGGGTSDESDGDSSTTDTESSGDEEATTVVIEDPDAGSLTHWLVLVLMMVCLTRLYGWHQSKLVPIRK